MHTGSVGAVLATIAACQRAPLANAASVAFGRKNYSRRLAPQHVRGLPAPARSQHVAERYDGRAFLRIAANFQRLVLRASLAVVRFVHPFLQAPFNHRNAPKVSERSGLLARDTMIGYCAERDGDERAGTHTTDTCSSSIVAYFSLIFPPASNSLIFPSHHSLQAASSFSVHSASTSGA